MMLSMLRTLFAGAVCSCVFLTLPACATGVAHAPATDSNTDALSVQSRSILLGKNDHFAVVKLGGDDDARSLAKHFYGTRDRYWEVEDANPDSEFKDGEVVAVPLTESNRPGFDRLGFSSVPILAYHRFGDDNSRLTVSKSVFESQMAFLKMNDYRVISMEHFVQFLAGERAVPRRAVMITIDDGHSSFYKIAYPILKRYGFPATLFPYAEFIDQGGLTWQQLETMQQSGIITIQLHSQSHSDLTVKEPGETPAQYRRRVAKEISAPKHLFRDRLNTNIYALAYPYGVTDLNVITGLKNSNLAAGFTVKRGSNPFFAYPYTLKRTQVYRDDALDDFKRILKTFSPLESG